MENMTCTKSPEHCALTINENITPIRTHLLRLFCDENGEGREDVPLFPHSLMKANEGRCRNW